MSKFFRKLGRFLKKIWEAVLKIVAIILAVVLVVILITTVVAMTTGYTFAQLSASLANLTASFLTWVNSVVGGGAGSWLARASAAVKGWAASEWIAAAAVSYGVGFGLMPDAMEWAVQRLFNGARYIGQQAIEVVGDIAETGVEVVGGVVSKAVSTVASSPLLLVAAAGAFIWYQSSKSTPKEVTHVQPSSA